MMPGDGMKRGLTAGLCLVVLPAFMHWITQSRFNRALHVPAESL